MEALITKWCRSGEDKLCEVMMWINWRRCIGRRCQMTKEINKNKMIISFALVIQKHISSELS